MYEMMFHGGPPPMVPPHTPITIGYSLETFQAVVWQPLAETNPSLLALGGSGSGKTELLRKLAFELFIRSFFVTVIDFHGDMNIPYMPLLSLSGAYEGSFGFNILELLPIGPDKTSLIDQVHALVYVIKSSGLKLGRVQEDVLARALLAAYERCGILQDDPTTWSNPPPTIAIVFGIMQKWLEAEDRHPQFTSIQSCLAAIKSKFSCLVFHRDKNITLAEILGGSFRLDLSLLNPSERMVIARCIMQRIFQYRKLSGVGEMCQVPKAFLVVDEAKLVNASYADKEAMENAVNQTICEGRKYGLGMVLGSQQAVHFSNDVMANCSAYLVLWTMSFKEASSLGKIVEVPPKYLQNLKVPGAGYFRSACLGKSVPVQVTKLGS